MEILARAVGRRKEAVAQVQIVRGTGQFVINNKPAVEYLQNNSFSMLLIKSPLEIFNDIEKEGTNQSLNGTASEKVTSLQTHHEFNLNFLQCDIFVKVKGGGLLGQTEAIKLAMSKAVSFIDYSNTETVQTVSPNFTASTETLALFVRKQLKNKGYLTQDSRVKERRKYGLKKARKASQYHKR
jgi:small subunit ribosomal protein S9